MLRNDEKVEEKMPDTQSKGRAHRLQVARRVSEVLGGFLQRGTFQEVHFGKVRVGRVTHRVLWHHGRVYRFMLDLDAGAVMFPALLPATASVAMPPQLPRELKAFLRSVVAGAARETNQIDPEKGELRVVMLHGSLTISITVRGDAYEYCMEQLMRTADALLTVFLEQPAYIDYRNGIVSTAIKID
ncbi:MAG TPA: hypothetical protein VGN07_16985 [Steroidobacteraceae bacterium]|jgi:hypothetical protein